MTFRLNTWVNQTLTEIFDSGDPDKPVSGADEEPFYQLEVGSPDPHRSQCRAARRLADRHGAGTGPLRHPETRGPSPPPPMSSLPAPQKRLLRMIAGRSSPRCGAIARIPGLQYGGRARRTGRASGRDGPGDHLAQRARARSGGGACRQSLRGVAVAECARPGSGPVRSGCCRSSGTGQRYQRFSACGSSIYCLSASSR